MIETQEKKKQQALTAPIHNAGSVGLKQLPAFIKFQVSWTDSSFNSALCIAAGRYASLG